MQLNERILKLDYLKGILIILMVYAHYIQIPKNSFIFSYTGYGLNGGIYTFHMPMLALISGYLAGKYPIKN